MSCALRFPGHYYDEETDFFENWNRYYDPATGRYLQPEPLLQGPGYAASMARSGMSAPTYAYAANNPVKFIDPDGRKIVTDWTNPGLKKAIDRYRSRAEGNRIWNLLESRPETFILSSQDLGVDWEKGSKTAGHENWGTTMMTKNGAQCTVVTNPLYEDNSATDPAALIAHEFGHVISRLGQPGMSKAASEIVAKAFGQSWMNSGPTP